MSEVYNTKIKEEKLLELANKRQQSTYEGYKNLSDYFGGFYECNYVSPYSKAGHNVNADVMVVLQDWTSDKGMGTIPCETMRDLGYAPSVKTNINLKKLMQKHLNLDFAVCYMTNLFPFVKMGKMSATIPILDLVKAAKDFTVPMIDIIQPKYVIALGIGTSDALRRACGNERLGLNAQDEIDNPFKRNETIIFPQFHLAARACDAPQVIVEKNWEAMKNKMGDLSK